MTPPSRHEYTERERLIDLGLLVPRAPTPLDRWLDAQPCLLLDDATRATAEDAHDSRAVAASIREQGSAPLIPWDVVRGGIL